MRHSGVEGQERKAPIRHRTIYSSPNSLVTSKLLRQGAQSKHTANETGYADGQQRSRLLTVQHLLTFMASFVVCLAVHHLYMRLLYCNNLRNGAECSPPDRFQHGTSDAPAAALATLLELANAPRFDIPPLCRHPFAAPRLVG